MSSNKNRQDWERVGKVLRKIFKPTDETYLMFEGELTESQKECKEPIGTKVYYRMYRWECDKCKKCGGKMTIDAMSNKQMNRKKIVTAIWGIDNTHIMLLLIMGIVTLILGVLVMYMYGDSQSAHAQITALQLELHPAINPSTGKPIGGN